MEKYIKPEIKAFNAELQTMMAGSEQGGVATGGTLGNKVVSGEDYAKEETFWNDEEW